MNHCPEDSMLTQLITDSLTADEQQALDAHVSICKQCQTRMESMAHVSEMSSVFGAVSKGPISESLNLKMVMERLQAESSNDVTSLSTPTSDQRGKATLPNLQPTLLPGYIGRLGSIQIRRVIGRGGMGVVFEGLDSVLNRTVAVKVLSPHLLEHPEAKSRFIREAQAAAALTHENVVAIHAISEADGMPFLVLQYVQGESLADRLQRVKKLPLSEVIRLGKQTARGLAAAHDRGMVHRDIKPGNIMLDSETGDARITDFGLAKHAGLDTMTAVGMLAGTPAYMSPEQAADGAVDARSDLFSLGVVLYQASSGGLPFQAESPFVLLNQISTIQEKPLREINPELPEWFCALVHRLLRKQPENRIASAHELADLLEQRVSLQPERPSTASGKGWIPLALASILVLAGSVAAVLYWQQQRDRGEARATTVAKPGLSGFQVSGNEQLFTTLADAVQAANDQAVIEVHGDGPFSTSTIKIEGKRLTIRAAPGSHPRFIPDTNGDGSYMQFLTTNADLHLEGLEIYWPLDAPAVKLDDPGLRGVIYSSDQALKVYNCRIIGGAMTACLGAGGRDVTIERCHLVSPQGACLGWRVSTSPVRMENNVLEGKVIFNIMRPTSSSSVVRKGMYVANNIMVAEKVAQFISENVYKSTFSMTFCRNVIDSPVLLTISAMPKNPLNVANVELLPEVIQSAIAWSEEANVYRKRIIFLSSARFMQPANLYQSELKQLDQWLKFWKMESSQSIEGTIRFQARSGSAELSCLTLERIDAPTGPLPKEYGPNHQYIGPGAAYAQWLKLGH